MIRFNRAQQNAKVFWFFFSKKNFFCLALALSPQAQAQTLKLTTWNLNWLTVRPLQHPALPADVTPRSANDFTRLRFYADKLDADIIAFEEVDGVASAARLFDPQHYTLITIHQDVVQQVGLAVRRPLTVRQNPDLEALDVEPAFAEHRLRHGLDATITFPNGASLRVLAVHLKTGCQTDPIRADPIRADPILAGAHGPCSLLGRQIPVLAAWAGARQAEGKAFALLGDFNRVMDEPEALGTALAAAAKLTRVTANASDPCWDGGAFIDHIFLGGAARDWLVPGSLRVMTYKDTVPGDRERLSDHCPVSVRLNPGRT